MEVEELHPLAAQICYAAPKLANAPPLLVLNLNKLPPADRVDYDVLQQAVLDIVDVQTFDAAYAATNPMYRKDGCLAYELVVFCAGGKHRPSWPWMIGEFAALNKKYKKALQRLYIVHEKSFVRVAMQLVEQAASPKLAKKVRHLRTLAELAEELGKERMQGLRVDEVVWQHDMQVMAELQQAERKKNKTRRSPPTPARTHSAPDLVMQAPSRDIHATKELPPPVMPRRPASTRPIITDVQRSDEPVHAKPPPRVPTTRSQQRLDQEECPTPIVSSSADAKRSISASSSISLIIHEDEALELPQKPAAPSPNATQKQQKESIPLPTKSKAASSKAQPLRRAISGPLTPAQGAIQNFLPKDAEMVALPSLKQQLKPTVRPPSPRKKPAQIQSLRASSEGRVGNLRALFEERAKVAEQLRSA
ncbi:divergent CRAL/TRIO domain-domain-containing protein [Protomyces lactucae-debilis]|uniref:Divergent CRAL/TRIO domain-domain-containing protein n=1 Tax=Protomyces lactucae-debilis TaxID=2754530 RepID=A0A1Y2FGJ8_PROLT|nr:divergent CRAL/TRIO domain-containing protein [Protomyces lactucae-debilis]ORY83043.1 divergent CRAL/TRIO domain-domain-containing protein [Protomyces lactucae-debilis]